MTQEISQELANEYREVAALVCMDLDCLGIAAERSDATADELRELIKLAIETKDQTTQQPEVRRRRYAAAAMLFSLPRATK